MKKEKYTGGWSANNDSIYCYGYSFSNKKTAVKSLKAMAKGNTFRGSHGYWSLAVEADNSFVAGGEV